MHWRRKWQPTPVFFPGESQGRGAGWAAVCGVTQSQTRLKRLSSSSSGCAGRQNPEPGAKITYNFPSGPSLGAFEPRVVNQVQTKFEPRVFSGQSPDRLLLSNAGRSWWPQRPQHSGNDASAQEQSNQWEKAVPHSLTQDAQSCPTLCDPMDHSPPGSSVHGIFQARILQQVAVSCYRVSS